MGQVRDSDGSRSGLGRVTFVTSPGRESEVVEWRGKSLIQSPLFDHRELLPPQLRWLAGPPEEHELLHRYYYGIVRYCTWWMLP
jgi:hypothetical protein